VHWAKLATAIILLSTIIPAPAVALAQQPADSPAQGSPPQRHIVCDRAPPPRGSHWVCDQPDRPCDCHLESNVPGRPIFGEGEAKPVQVPEQEPTTDAGNCNQFAVQDFVAPVYPPRARTARIEGKVTIQARLDATGRVASMTSDGHPLLVAASEKSLRQWSFRKLATSDTLTLIFQFKLGAPGKHAPPVSKVTAHFPCQIEITAAPPPVH